MYSVDWLRSLVEKIEQSRRNAHVSIQCDEAGFEVVANTSGRAERIEHFTWASVAKVFAYKKDCFAIDQICLVIGSSERWIEITEDDEGYAQLVQQLEKRLDSFPASEAWWQMVALPPFKAQWTQLYGSKS